MLHGRLGYSRPLTNQPEFLPIVESQRATGIMQTVCHAFRSLAGNYSDSKKNNAILVTLEPNKTVKLRQFAAQGMRIERAVYRKRSKDQV